MICPKHNKELRNGKDGRMFCATPVTKDSKGKVVELTKSKYALVDNEDFDYLDQFKWFYDGRYACRMTSYSEGRKKVYMHNFILVPQQEYEVDHINMNKLDNRLKNLRLVKRGLNIQNIGLKRNNTSGYKGVTWSKQRQKWIAQTSVNKKHIINGGFKTKQEAALAYNELAIKYFGENARLNQI